MMLWFVENICWNTDKNSHLEFGILVNVLLFLVVDMLDECNSQLDGRCTWRLVVVAGVCVCAC